MQRFSAYHTSYSKGCCYSYVEVDTSTQCKLGALLILICKFDWFVFIFTVRCYARVVYAIAPCLVCLSMSVSVTSRSSIETAERIDLVFCVYAFLTYSTLCYKEIQISLWDFVPNSGLRKFHHGISIVETCYHLSSGKVDAQSVINWTVVGQRSW